MPDRLCAAVLVIKSLALVPVSAEKTTVLTAAVGATMSTVMAAAFCAGVTVTLPARSVCCTCTAFAA